MNGQLSNRRDRHPLGCGEWGRMRSKVVRELYVGTPATFAKISWTFSKSAGLTKW